jgi:hypothetical protein
MLIKLVFSMALLRFILIKLVLRSFPQVTFINFCAPVACCWVIGGASSYGVTLLTLLIAGVVNLFGFGLLLE